MVWLAEVLVVTAVLNFLAAAFAFSLIGGDPFSGRAENGHFFYTDHHHVIEVSALVFFYSQWHVRSLYVTQTLGGLAMLWLWLRKRGSN